MPNLDESEDTRRFRLVRSQSELPKLSDDTHEALGQIMAEVAKGARAMGELRQLIEVQARELGGLRRDIELDRTALVRGASHRAAARSSNRMAALLGTLFVLYEQAAPILRELWRGLSR